MGLRTADLSRNIYNEQKQYTKPIAQQGPNRPQVDADANDGYDCLFTFIRRTLQILGDGSPNNGFLVIESGISNVNNFTIRGGNGTLDGAGRVMMTGLMALLVNDIDFNTPGTNAQWIHDRSTGLTASVLTNTGANWNVNEFAGRTLVPNTLNGTGFTIASNTATAITIAAGDMTTVAAVLDNYRIDPSTPGAPRNDVVYLDLYIDETDAIDDPNLKHPLAGGSSFVSFLRDHLKHIVKVRESSTTIPSSPFVDVDGNVHYYLKMATLARDANNTITTAEITDNIPRDIFDIPAIRAEVIAARGSMGSLDARLDVSLEEDGDLKADTVGSSQIVDDSIMDVDVNSAADIDQNKLSNSDTYDDTFTGAPSDIEDDLNRIRNEVKVTKGSVDWETDPTRSLNSVEAEQTTARGSKASVDARLDVSLNEDGTIKANAVALQVPRIAAEPALIFYPKDGSWSNTYRLHQFRGEFIREWGLANTVHGPYINFDLSHGSYALDVIVGAAAGPGGSDNQAASIVFAQKWMNIYLIGKADGTVALVSSDASGRPPFGSGPLLDSSVYDFPTNGWIYWKFIGAVRNRSAAGWDLVPIRKKGNHCSYEQAHLVQAGGLPLARTQYSIATRIPPTSMRANLFLHLVINNGAQASFFVSPASVVSAGESMLMQDPAPADPNAMQWKLQANAGFTISGVSENHASVPGWCGTDDAQRIDIWGAFNAVAYAEWFVYVLGYEEFTDTEDSELIF